MLKLALTAKWITALVLCLLMAVAFALLAQWQINRSVLPNSDNDKWTKVSYVALDTVAEPNKPFSFMEVSKEGQQKVLTLVSTRVTQNPGQAVLIANRVQVDGTKGYWLVVPTATVDARVFVAVGFISDLSSAKVALGQAKLLYNVQSFRPLAGRYLPSEAPEPALEEDLFSSMSVAQLINLRPATLPAYSGFIAITKPNAYTQLPGVEAITIGLAKSDSQLNWLSAFYAIEWTVFAGFAVFMWWRLLADAYKKQQEALLDSAE
ncbi:MAG: hypothetical protein EBS85_02660 [Micrococcales bacterium]|nr:hypothetical protein [Actinomycetota bacterium]NCA07615.1 hypothetical protein [Micrococcales bacterium]